MDQKALVVIDVQNDYFPKGNYPLWDTQETLRNTILAIKCAHKKNIPVIHIQHIASVSAPFFSPGTEGVKIHPEILAAAPNSDVVTKSFADSFEQTDLEEVLDKYKITTLLICGMMTHNCVTHTAISKAAEKYEVSVVTDCCTTVDEMLHNLALNALSVRVSLVTTAQVFY